MPDGVAPDLSVAPELSVALDQVLPGSTVGHARPEDVAELVVLQRCCWVEEALVNNLLDIPALHETHDEVEAWATSWTTYVVRLGDRPDGRLIAAVRGVQNGATWNIGRLMVAPDLAGRGIGTALLRLIEDAAPPSSGTLPCSPAPRANATSASTSAPATASPPPPTAAPRSPAPST